MMKGENIMDMEAKKRELARRIERLDNSLMRAHAVNQHNICMKWINQKQGMEEAFKIIFGQDFIDYWLETVAEEYD